jgi:galacturan 1,4-alpha-galacturonidase
MKLSLLPVSALVTACAAASTTPQKRNCDGSARPDIVYSPETPITAPSPSQRNSTCYVESHGDDETDDSDYILAALNKCNNGGRVIFRENDTYIIGTAMDWTFLQSIDIGELDHLV